MAEPPDEERGSKPASSEDGSLVRERAASGSNQARRRDRTSPTREGRCLSRSPNHRSGAVRGAERSRALRARVGCRTFAITITAGLPEMPAFRLGEAIRRRRATSVGLESARSGVTSAGAPKGVRRRPGNLEVCRGYHLAARMAARPPRDRGGWSMGPESATGPGSSYSNSKPGGRSSGRQRLALGGELVGPGTGRRTGQTAA